MSVTADAADGQSVDAGLACLVLMLRYTGAPADPAQLRHRFGNAAEQISATDILRTAKELGLKSRVVSSKWPGLAQSPLPAIAATKEGGFFILAKVAEDKALIHDPIENRLVTMSRAELDAVWNGKLSEAGRER
jgi:subfamily B ATP-binding cassette protein HlyB/CyaB